MSAMISSVIVWALGALGFWWFPNKDNSIAEGRQLIFHGRDERGGSNFNFSVSWAFGKKATFCHAYIEFAGEDDYKFSLAVPRLFQWWLAIDNAKPFIFWDPKETISRSFKVRNPDGTERIAYCGRWWQGRQVGIAIYGGRLRLFLFSDMMNHAYYKHTWFSRKMREPSLDVKGIYERLVFGKEIYSNIKLSDPTPIRIPMPEGNFYATIQHGRQTWGWQRFRKPTVKDYTSIELDVPPRFAGKGENDWDMDDDAIYATAFYGHLTPDEAAGQYRDRVLEYRTKYGEPGSYQPEGEPA